MTEYTGYEFLGTDDSVAGSETIKRSGRVNYGLKEIKTEDRGKASRESAKISFHDTEPVYYEDLESAEAEGDIIETIAPTDVTDEKGMREIYLPELVSMTKVLFSKYKGPMYLYLNRCLRSGELSRLVGNQVLEKKINRQVCGFTDVTYWRIDRENFYADVKVELRLQMKTHEIKWEGILVCWCGFDPKLYVSFEGLMKRVDRSDFDQLSRFLVPYATNKRIDEIAEEIWERCCQKALTDPRWRNAEYLAEKMGLSVIHCPVYDHQGVDSIVFFKEDTLEIGEDREEKDEDGNITKHIKADEGKKTKIPANTIVVNSNKIKSDYSDHNIFHECYHYDQHYLFYCLQELASNDRRQVPVRKVVIGRDEEVKDEMFFIEQQAERGALGLKMPATHTKQMILEECEKIHKYSNTGELYEAAGKAIHTRLSVPDFRVRQRMIQLGHVRARGALNRANRMDIEPFAFEPDSWRSSEYTFVIDLARVNALMEKNEDFRFLMDSRRYIYADGHVVRNTPEFVYYDEERDEYLLTDKARAGVDLCCLRFVRKYIQKNIGRYVYGRLYYDPEYVKQCEFYLSDSFGACLQ